jgi:hypothetical protein
MIMQCAYVLHNCGVGSGELFLGAEKWILFACYTNIEAFET